VTTAPPGRLLLWTAGVLATVAAVATTAAIAVRVTGVGFSPIRVQAFHDCGPAMVAALKQEAIFRVADDGRAAKEPGVECKDRDDGMAAEATADFRTTAPAHELIARFGEVATGSRWTVLPVHGPGPSPQGVLACARKDVAGQAWQSYVNFDGDTAGHYWIVVDVDSSQALC
jgi:hypothetical protein